MKPLSFERVDDMWIVYLFDRWYLCYDRAVHVWMKGRVLR